MPVSINAISMPFISELILLAIFSFWAATIIEVAISSFSSKYAKLLWILVVVLLGIIGCLIYIVAGRKYRIKNAG
jgi:hypothetical protein